MLEEFLLVLSDPTDPIFEVQPKGQVLNVGQTAVLECGSNGFPSPRVVWLKDQSELRPAGRFSLVGQGTLVIDGVQASDGGVYTCRCINSEESVDASASLEVRSEEFPLLSCIDTEFMGQRALDRQYPTRCVYSNA